MVAKLLITSSKAQNFCWSTQMEKQCKCLLFFLFFEILSPNGPAIKAIHGLGGTLTQAVKQPYSVYCLTEANIIAQKNMKCTSKNNSSISKYFKPKSSYKKHWKNSQIILN